MKRLMARRSVSFRGLAFVTGLDAGYLCRIANGERRPSREAAVAIAKALGVGPGLLWGRGADLRPARPKVAPR